MKAKQSFETSGSIGVTTARHIPQVQPSAKPLREPQIRVRWDGFRTFTGRNMGKEATPRQKYVHFTGHVLHISDVPIKIKQM
jgi:hypothetical protein